MNLDVFVSCDIRQNIDRIEKIIATGIFKPANAGNPLVKSAFTELMICLRDLMEKTKTFATPISFVDDVTLAPKLKINDVSDLITFIRDALCHIAATQKHFVVPNKIKASFNIVYGKGTLAPHPGISLTSDYPDDICFFFGVEKIYLRRHVLRAFEETKRQLVPLLPRESPPDIVVY